MALHVDYEIRWKNFRSLTDTGWITIKPITILLGVNNAGKTSVLAPLLLLNQTMIARDAVTPLVTRGPIVDAGTFKDIVNNHDLDKDIFFGVRFHTHDPRPKLAKVGSYPPGAVEFILSTGDKPQDIIVKQFQIFDVYKRIILTHSRNKNGKYGLQGISRTKMRTHETNAVRNMTPTNFAFSPAAAIREYEDSQRNKDVRRKTNVDFSPQFSLYLSSIGYAFSELGDLFGGLSYIGPLRERPHRFYQKSGEVPRSVGTRGEHTANLIQRQIQTLKKPLNNWIRRFEFGDELKMRRLSDELFTLEFYSKKEKSNTNIADAGFGASQVLPLLVQALSASKGSLTIAEQPEIHLNPRLQSVLADLFVAMAKNDNRVIIETHSEHLLLRLRRLIAAGELNANQVAVYFIEKSDGISNIRAIPISEDGGLQDNTWPKGFFEDTLRESLALASAQSKRSGSKGR